MEGASAHNDGGANNSFDEGMNKVVISMNPERQEALDFGYERIPGMMYDEVPMYIKKNFKIAYNEHKKHPETGKFVPPAFDEEANHWTSLPDLPEGKKPRARMGCFGAHCRALEYVRDNKIDNVAILEDDAQIDREQMGIKPGEVFDTSYFPKDHPTLLGATFRHPTNFRKDKEYMKTEIPKYLSSLSRGVYEIPKDKVSWSQTHAIYYPTHQVAGRVLEDIKKIGEQNTAPLGSGPYRHYDQFLSPKMSHLVKYFHYPSLFTHNDGITAERQPKKKAGSSIGAGEGIVKNYINMGKKPKDIAIHTPPFQWKGFVSDTNQKVREIEKPKKKQKTTNPLEKD